MPNAIEVIRNFQITDATATITRPADTTPYVSGDLLANSVTAGSVNVLIFNAPANHGCRGTILAARMQKSTNSTANAAFRLHLFQTVPTFVTAGDNSPINTVVVASGKGYLGFVDITAMNGFSDVALGTGAVDNARYELPYVPLGTQIFGIIEVRGAYAPGNAEVFTISLIHERHSY